MDHSKPVEVGDKVCLPWGFEEVEGRVLSVYGPPASRHVLIEVDIEGSHESLSLPLHAVRPLEMA